MNANKFIFNALEYSLSGVDDIVELISLKVDIYLNARICGDWRLDAHPQGDTCFHMATQNQARLLVPDVGEWLLQEGDLVIFPREIAHSLRPAADLTGAQQQLPISQSQHLQGTSFVCGKVRFRHTGSELLLDALPTVFVIRRDDNTPWLGHLLALIVAESFHSDGSEPAILNRLCELLFSYALRHFVDSSEQQTGILSLFSHRQIHKAIKAIHKDPQCVWQLTTLASTAGMSRTRFAQVFKALSGWTPMQYISWWRMQLAWGHLQAGQTVAAVADKVGYQSEAAFSRAFRKQFGVSAGSVRRGK